MNNLGNLRLRSFNFEKSQKNELFWGFFPKTFFLSADTYFDHGVSPIAEGVEFLPFFGLGRRKNNDILGIYFVRNNYVFSDALEPVQNKIPKKVTFLGEFSRIYFWARFLFSIMFLHYAFWVVPDVRLAVRKSANFSEKCPKKWRFFAWDTIRYFLAPALSLRRRIPYLSANRLEPRISRDQHIQTCQFKTTNVKIHPAVLKVYTHLISFGQMEMANASGNFGITLVGLRNWNDAIHDFRRIAFFRTEKKKRFFGHLKKCCFFGPRLPDDGPKKSWLSNWLAIWLAGWLSSWLAIWLTRWLFWLAGYLAIGFVAAWLAIWLLAIWLAGWLADWHWLSGWLSEWLALWLAIWLSKWLAGYLAGWLGGSLSGWWLAGWRVGWPTGWLAGELAGWLFGWLSGWLAIWLAGWLSGSLSSYLACWLGGGLLTGWLIGWWQARWLAACLAGRLTGGAGGLVGYLAGWLCWLSGWLCNWLKGYLALDGYLAIGLASYLADWLAACLRGWLAGWLANWLASWLAGYLAGYVAGWLCGWLAGYLAIR